MTLSKNAELEERGREIMKMWHKRQEFTLSPSGLNYYQPRPSDVIIATYPKSGTTLLQNMVYQIVVGCGGGPANDPDGTQFTDISVQCPWLDFGPEMGVPEAKSNPRIFKTHSDVSCYEPFLSTPRFIYCIRDVHDIPGSFLDFSFDPFMVGKHLDMETREAVYHAFLDYRFVTLPQDSDVNIWYRNVRGWTTTSIPNILILFYEEVKEDLRGTARRIARFLELGPLPSKTLDIVEERCSRKWMLANPAFQTTVESQSFGHPPLPKVIEGERAGFNKMKTKMTEEEKTGISNRIVEYLGVPTYEELVVSLKEKQRKMHPEYEDNLEEKMD